MVKILILCGLEGVGKTTYAQDLQSKYQDGEVEIINFFDGNQDLRKLCKLYINVGIHNMHEKDLFNLELALESQGKKISKKVYDAVHSKKKIIILERFLLDTFFFQREMKKLLRNEILGDCYSFSKQYKEYISVLFFNPEEDSEDNKQYRDIVQDLCSFKLGWQFRAIPHYHINEYLNFDL